MKKPLFTDKELKAYMIDFLDSFGELSRIANALERIAGYFEEENRALAEIHRTEEAKE